MIEVVTVWPNLSNMVKRSAGAAHTTALSLVELFKLIQERTSQGADIGALAEDLGDARYASWFRFAGDDPTTGNSYIAGPETVLSVDPKSPQVLRLLVVEAFLPTTALTFGECADEMYKRSQLLGPVEHEYAERYNPYAVTIRVTHECVLVLRIRRLDPPIVIVTLRILNGDEQGIDKIERFFSRLRLGQGANRSKPPACARKGSLAYLH